MNPLRLLIAAMLGLAPALAAQQKVDVRYAVAPDVSLRLNGSIGRVRVVGWDRDSVVVTGSLPKGVRLESAVGGDGKTPARGMKMYVDSPNDYVSSTGVLELRVPARARVWLKGGTSQIEARDVTGGLDINLIGGTVSVVGSPRELQVEAMDAVVTIEGSPAWMRAKTAAGDITMRGGSSDAALTSISGTIRVDGGPWERTRIETVTGGVYFSGDLVQAAEFSVDTHSGAIELRLSPKGNYTVNASTITGTIENSLSGKAPSPGREGRGQTLAIYRGNEGANVTLRTFKGNIVISPR